MNIIARRVRGLRFCNYKSEQNSDFGLEEGHVSQTTEACTLEMEDFFFFSAKDQEYTFSFWEQDFIYLWSKCNALIQKVWFLSNIFSSPSNLCFCSHIWCFLNRYVFPLACLLLEGKPASAWSRDTLAKTCWFCFWIFLFIFSLLDFCRLATVPANRAAWKKGYACFLLPSLPVLRF